MFCKHTFPGSSFGLGTFRKHLFSERLCLIEFCEENIHMVILCSYLFCQNVQLSLYMQRQSSVKWIQLIAASMPAKENVHIDQHYAEHYAACAN